MSDYISRGAAVKIAQKYGLTNGSVLGHHTGLADCIALEIAGLPAAEVEPVRHGEWLLVRRMAACGEYKCSVCGRIEIFGCFNKPENNPYCHCGAKMDLENNNGT